MRRRHDSDGGWDNVRGTIATDDGEQTVFLKRHLLPELARREADGVAACQRAGVPVMTVLAVGSTETGRCETPAFYRGPDRRRVASVLMTAEAGTTDAARLLADRADPEAVLPPVARTLGSLHAAGLIHNDCSLVHFRMSGLGDATARLIDLQNWRAYPTGSRAHQSRQVKDLALVRSSLLRIGLGKPVTALWWSLYAAAYEAGCGHPPPKGLRSLVAVRSDVRRSRAVVRAVRRGRWHRLLPARLRRAS